MVVMSKTFLWFVLVSPGGGRISLDDLATSSPLPDRTEAGAEQKTLLSAHLQRLVLAIHSLYRPVVLSRVGGRGLMEPDLEPLREVLSSTMIVRIGSEASRLRFGTVVATATDGRSFEVSVDELGVANVPELWIVMSDGEDIGA